MTELRKVPDPLQPSRPTTAFRGAVLTVTMRWTDRLMGLVSTMILARLLVPEDFGLVAMAMAVAGLVEVMLDLGVAAALIQNTTSDREHFNTAWTLRLCQATVAAALLAISAPFAADFFNDYRVSPILMVVAVTAFIGGLENIGTVSFQKNMEFGRDFQYLFLRRLLGVVVTIGAAVTLRSYWALVLGSLVSRCAGVVISYMMSAFRPRISLSRFSSIWAFSQWSLVSAIGHHLAINLSRFVVGKRTDATVLGAYSMGEEIASMPTSELLAPLGRVMFPVFSAAKGNPKELLRVVRLSLSIQALVALPAGVGVALVAHDAIAVLLGEKWSIAVPYTQIIAVASIPLALCHSSVYMLGALAKMRQVAAYNWSKVVMLLLATGVFFPSAGAKGVAFAYLATAFAGLAVIQVLARSALPTFHGGAFLTEIWRPLLAVALMALAVWRVTDFFPVSSPVLRLCISIVVGAVTYVLAVVFMWRLAGSPTGAETYVLEKARAARRPSESAT